MRHNANLDILRSFAVFTVLLEHLMHTIQAHDGFSNAGVIAFTANIGHVGVLAFFVHTSLVLMYSLERMHTTPARITSRFYIRRFFRIYPLALFAIFVVLLLHLPASSWSPNLHFTTKIVLANIFLVQNLFGSVSVLGPLWSLPYEIQMYVFLPFLFLLSRRRNALYYLSALIVFFCIVGTLLAYKTGHLNMAAFVPCFLSGVLCYSLRNRMKAIIPAIVWPLFLLMLIAAFCISNLYDSPSWLHRTPTFWSGWIFTLVLGLSINAFRDSKARAGNLIASKVALYSYGIYLLHQPILDFVFLHLQLQNLLIAIPLFLLLTLAVAILAFHLIESPLIEMGRRLSSPGHRASSVSTTNVMPAP